MDLGKFYEWLDNINSVSALRNRGLIINGKEAWKKGAEEERNRILEIIKTISIDNKSCIDEATSKSIVMVVLTRIYNKILNTDISEQDLKKLMKEN